MYTMYAALARDRSRELQVEAAHHRLCQQLTTARMWNRLAAFTARRAVRSQRRLAEDSAADYQLVG